MKKLVLILTILISFACQPFVTDVEKKFAGLTPEEKEEIRRNWKNSGACMNLHTFGFYDGLQQPDLQIMIDAGLIKWVRLGNLDVHGGQAFAQWFIDRGVQVLGIFENSYIKRYYDDPGFDITGAFSKVISENPEVKYWSVGNETEVFIWWPDEKGNEIHMTPAQYMPIFKKVFFYACENHPDITLMNAPTLGITGGADRLGDLIDNLGLGDLSYGIVSQEDIETYNLRKYHIPEFYRLKIIGFNFYSYRSDATDVFSFQLKKLSPKTRRWITETGIEDWSKHLEFERLIYPKMINMIGAEKIFWYTFAMYALYDKTDPENRLDFSFRSNLPPPSPDPAHMRGDPEWSPLAKVLLKIEN